MKVLITGAAGQLGHALMEQVPAGVHADAFASDQLDITDEQALLDTLSRIQPAVLINAAAYTAVDRAESERERAFAVNADAVGSMARVCRQRGIRLVHVSTDFVFDGAHGRPYRTDDAPGPINVYGASKLEGEHRIVAEPGLDWRIVRSAWVYGSRGHNFMLTMLRLFRDRDSVQVVTDQIGAPTSVASLAECVWAAASAPTGGLLHFTNSGVASWYDFALAIYEEARSLALISRAVDIVAIRSDQYPTAARRPSYSVLDVQSTVAQLGLKPIHWRVSLRSVLRELGS
jgi:dTDP-4-dehydrorhamnose reductase